MYVAVHCALKDLPKKQALFFTVEENKLPLIGKEVYSSIINYLQCELEGMKEQAADSCFPVARPAAAAA